MIVSPKRGLLGPSEELQLNLELTAHTEVRKAAGECLVSGRVPCLATGARASWEADHTPCS